MDNLKPKIPIPKFFQGYEVPKRFLEQFHTRTISGSPKILSLNIVFVTVRNILMTLRNPLCNINIPLMLKVLLGTTDANKEPLSVEEEITFI